jgi:CO dehydrogenase maturation factor
MRIAFVGKGGSGKTTLAALFARHLVADGAPVLAIDADINQNLAEALGATPGQASSWPTLGDHLDQLKEYLRGDNPRLRSAASMIKTTPPGPGSRLLRPFTPGSVLDACARPVAGVRLAVTGVFDSGDLGVSCYHSKVGAVELVLNHLVDTDGEYVIVDMTAGADAFASGLFTRFDLTVVVCEPTQRSVGVYRQYRDYCLDFGVAVTAVGNKVSDERDLDFLRGHLGSALLGSLGVSPYVRAGEQDRLGPISTLEPANRSTLDTIRQRLDATLRDWVRLTRLAVEFHLRNAAAWGNVRTGLDLATQVDPDYVLSPAVPMSAGI